MNLWVSAISAHVRGRSLPGRVWGTPGRSSMAWSQIVCWGRHCDSSSLNTLLWCWYSAGTLGGSVDDVTGLWKVTHPMKYWAWETSLGTFLVHGMKDAFFTLGARRVMVNWVWSIHPLLQSMSGCTTVNQEYPKMALCSPKLVRKNWRVIVWFLFWHSGLCSTWVHHFCSLCHLHWTVS